MFGAWSSGRIGANPGPWLYREAGLPNTFGCIPAEKSGPEKIYSDTEPYPPLRRGNSLVPGNRSETTPGPTVFGFVAKSVLLGPEPE